MIPCAMTYLKKDGKTLMIHKNKNPDKLFYGFWDAPGGKIEPGETPEQAAVREFKEETNLDLKDPKLRCVFTFRNLQAKDFLVHIFTATDFEGELIEENREGSLRWIDDKEFFNLKLCDADHIFIPMLAKHDFLKGEFHHDDNDKLIKHRIDFH